MVHSVLCIFNMFLDGLEEMKSFLLILAQGVYEIVFPISKYPSKYDDKNYKENTSFFKPLINISTIFSLMLDCLVINPSLSQFYRLNFAVKSSCKSEILLTYCFANVSPVSTKFYLEPAAAPLSYETPINCSFGTNQYIVFSLSHYMLSGFSISSCGNTFEVLIHLNVYKGFPVFFI